jgi:hypothetical protein
MRILFGGHFEFMPCLTMSDYIFCLSSICKIYHKKEYRIDPVFFFTFSIHFAPHQRVPAFKLLPLNL